MSLKPRAAGRPRRATWRNSIRARLDELPDEPRDHNFWNFHRHKWVKAEALDYAMSALAVALICEQPDVFEVSMKPI